MSKGSRAARNKEQMAKREAGAYVPMPLAIGGVEGVLAVERAGNARPQLFLVRSI
jgi:hypothetical protein